jgi:malonyl-CoA/methylmalonyl-CoA synthetase
MNLYAGLETCFRADRSRTFAMQPDGAILTYAEVNASSARYANALRDVGVSTGDRVAVQVEKGMEMVALYLGCLRAGAVFLPLNPAYTPVELEYFLGDAEPALFVSDPASEEPLRAVVARAGVGRLETLDGGQGGTLAGLARASPSTFETVERGADDLAAILYTSGTTGHSKGAMLTHGNLASNALTLRDCWRFGPDDVLLHALPIFHTHGLFVAINVTLAAGASMIFLPRFDMDEMLRWLPGATVMMGVPTFYTRLLADERFTKESAAHMRLFVSGSAPLSAEVHREFAERTGHAILERYGMTETNMNTSNPYDGERIAGTVGLPLPGVRIRIADQETGRLLPQGGIGVIEIAGPNVFKGYWRAPDKTAAEFRDGWFVSGDLGLIDERGYISILGRAKDLIISGGHNIYPAEVEAALDELPQVGESAVIGVPHSDLGEAALAVVVARDPGFTDADALKAALDGRLARFKQPRRIVFLAALPRNAMGKVQKSALRELYADSFAPKA